MPKIEPPAKRFYWTAQLVKGGVDVGVATFFDGPYIEGEVLDRSPRWQALVRDETTARAILEGDHMPIEIEGMGLRRIRPTTRANYEFLVAHAAYSTAHAPHNPDASPRVAVDFNTYKPF